MKKLISFICVALCAVTAAHAAPNKGGEDWSLIDFDRIRLSEEERSYPVSYTIIHTTDMMVEIPLHFGGELVKTRDINQSDKKKAVRQALEEKGWNFAVLAKYMGTVEKYKAINYSKEQFYEDVKATVGINGYITDALELITGYKDRNEYFKYETYKKRTRENSLNYTIGKGLDIFGEIKGIPLLGQLANIVGRYDVFTRAGEREKQKWTNRVAEINRREINAFYDCTCKYLERIALQKEKSWMLRVHGCANAPFWYDQVQCTQHWTVSMELTKNPFGDDARMSHERFAGSYEGEYIGWMDAEVLYSMANWDAQYFVDKQIRQAVASQTVGDIMKMSVSDPRIMQSYLKMYSDELGLPFRHEAKPTQAHNIFRLPVRVFIQAPADAVKCVCPGLEILSGDEEWTPGDKPKPEITKTFQLVHKVSVKGKKDGVIFDYMADYYATEDELIYEHSDLTVATDPQWGAILALSATNGKVEKTVNPLNPEGFKGRPDGNLEIYLDQSAGAE